MKLKGKIYRYWVYKKMFTPYEQEQKFKDESQLWDDTCNYGRLVYFKPIQGDILLGLQQEWHVDGKKKTYIGYYLKSEIVLDWWEEDQDMTEIVC